VNRIEYNRIEQKNYKNIVNEKPAVMTNYSTSTTLASV